MSTQEDGNQYTLEKLKTYRDLTVEAPSPNSTSKSFVQSPSSVSVSTAASRSVLRTSSQEIRIISCVSDNESKLATMNSTSVLEKDIPPYTNVLNPAQNCVRVRRTKKGVTLSDSPDVRNEEFVFKSGSTLNQNNGNEANETAIAMIDSSEDVGSQTNQDISSLKSECNSEVNNRSEQSKSITPNIAVKTYLMPSNSQLVFRNSSDEKSSSSNDVHEKVQISRCVKESDSKLVSASPPKKVIIPTTPRLMTISTVPKITPTTNSRLRSLKSGSLSDDKQFLEELNAGSHVKVSESVTCSIITPPNSDVKTTKMEARKVIVAPKQVNPNLAKTVLKLDVTDNVIGDSNAETDSDDLYQSNEDLTCKDVSSMSISMESTDLEKDKNSDFDKKQDEPECLTISSGEEDEAEELDQVLCSSNVGDLSVSIVDKEPMPLKSNDPDEKSNNKDSNYDVCYVLADESMSESEIENALDTVDGNGYMSLNCRTVRIGSFKVCPRFPVVVSKYGLRITIPSTTSSELVTIKIPIQEIQKILVHFGSELPVIFYYVTIPMGAKIRELLNMRKNGGVYFDPASSNHSHRRITLLPEILTEANREFICDLYPLKAKLDELNHQEANELLLKSTPREQVAKVMRHVPPFNPIQTIMVFPPPPAKGGISINTEDYACLAEDTYLNDVIIDFYLKYLYMNATEQQKQKTHIFSSFFYKRLTDKATPMPRNLQTSGSTVTAADIRHSRVKNWTKNIDLFSKDFIVIPLNENQHWFLAIICFPGLRGPVRMSDDTPIDLNPKKEETIENTNKETHATEAELSCSSAVNYVSSCTKSAMKPEKSESSFVMDDGDVEERDEAEATDEETSMFSDCGDFSDGENLDNLLLKIEESNSSLPKGAKEPIKQPCILIFDSLAGASRARIINTLREYLRIEYKLKHGEDRDFSKKVVKGACPKVPQQDNFVDCGLFVLQFVEAFFVTPIEDYRIPIRSLKNWFPTEVVSKKRYNIQQLLLKLMREQNIDPETLNLPPLFLDETEYDDDDCYDDDYYGEEEEVDPEYDYDEENGMREHFFSRECYQSESDDELVLEEDDDEMEPGQIGHYALYNSDEEVDDPDGDSDDIYGDLENLEGLKERKSRRNLQRRMDQISGYEDDEEEMNLEMKDDYDSDDQQLSSDVEEKLENSNVNRETVSISKVRSQASTSALDVTSTISPGNASISLESRSNRPRDVELDDEDGSSKKKFKSN